MLQQEFENIAASLRHRIVSVARGYGLDVDTAEDVAQDAMLKLWTIRAKVASGKQATALGVVIAKHLSVDVLRRSRSVGLDCVCTADDQYRQPDKLLEASENDDWLKMQLNRLPSKEYAVLHLRQVEQKTTEEIAAIVGVKQSSVPTMLARARRKLLDEMNSRNK